VASRANFLPPSTSTSTFRQQLAHSSNSLINAQPGPVRIPKTTLLKETSLGDAHLEESNSFSYPDGENAGSVPEMANDQEHSPRGFGEVNNRTQGKEFYGPAATLAFLLELRRCARAYQESEAQDKANTDCASSIVNFLHGDNEMLAGKTL
jgi:hypothetical protein